MPNAKAFIWPPVCPYAQVDLPTSQVKYRHVWNRAIAKFSARVSNQNILLKV